ncbi:MAG: PrsW family intramembrane metalloprotease [Phycisphaerales bacterium]|jgi:RsiW-degrading membrane proteinase PrsW (M82 family)|nr:PrsW family intramembrane metalloprotease [Phycisphaerales bacterium]
MSRERCGRCGCDLGAGREGVFYCENCLRTSRHAGHAGMWWATIIALILMVGGGVTMAIMAPKLTISSDLRLLIGLGLTLVPALFWLIIFYSADKLEPEPKGYVFGLFILGILLGGAIQQPIQRDIYELQRWLLPSIAGGKWIPLVGSFLLKGIVTAALTYFAVRFTVMPTSEFDERVDGIIYGTAAALGLGVAANLAYLSEHGTISLGVGALQIIITSLAYASFGAIMGYFIGLIKPGGGASVLAPFGVIVTAIIQGLYEWMVMQMGSNNLNYNPWPSLIATAVFAAVAYAVVFILIASAYRAMVVNPSGKESLA